jgi:predicted RNA-binding Zn ribbon-like protein
MTDTDDGPLFYTGDHPVSVASDLLNTVDLLAAPADRLTTVEHLEQLLSAHAYPTEPLTADDLELVRRTREQVRAVWQSADLAQAADRLDTLLVRLRPHPRVTERDGRVVMTFGDRSRPARAMVDEILAGLGAELVAHGVARLGTCAGDPCRCVFLDRSRNRSRRYCCEICTNRAAAAAYRRRARTTRGDVDG